MPSQNVSRKFFDIFRDGQKGKKELSAQLGKVLDYERILECQDLQLGVPEAEASDTTNPLPNKNENKTRGTSDNSF